MVLTVPEPSTAKMEEFLMVTMVAYAQKEHIGIRHGVSLIHAWVGRYGSTDLVPVKMDTTGMAHYA
jgi:hypothetical protein